MKQPIKCGCGRSPTGLCVGFHALDEDEWTGGMTQLSHVIKAGQGNPQAEHIIYEDAEEDE